MTKQTTPQEAPILEWNALQHQDQHRGRIWYAVAAISVAFCLIYSVIARNWIFTVLIVVLAILYWKMHVAQQPRRRVRIWRQGFAMDDTYTDWGNCKGYWIIGGEGYNELHIETQSGKDMKVLTGDINPYLLHELLQNVLPHLSEKRESIVDTIIRICKL